MASDFGFATDFLSDTATSALAGADSATFGLVTGAAGAAETASGFEADFGPEEHPKKRAIPEMKKTELTIKQLIFNATTKPPELLNSKLKALQLMWNPLTYKITTRLALCQEERRPIDHPAGNFTPTSGEIKGNCSF